MLLAENIRIALNGLKANRMRALLTMLGIIIGIASVIAIVSVGDSMTNGINESMSGMGVRNVTLSLTQKDEENTSAGSFFMFGIGICHLRTGGAVSEDIKGTTEGSGVIVKRNSKLFGFVSSGESPVC